MVADLQSLYIESSLTILELSCMCLMKCDTSFCRLICHNSVNKTTIGTDLIRNEKKNLMKKQAYTTHRLRNSHIDSMSHTHRQTHNVTNQNDGLLQAEHSRPGKLNRKLWLEHFIIVMIWLNQWLSLHINKQTHTTCSLLLLYCHCCVRLNAVVSCGKW